jgi:hypothetical protein
MKLPIALSLGVVALVFAPQVRAEARKPVVHPTPPPARTTHPPTALHQQPHSKNAAPGATALHLPQLPPPDAHPTTPPAPPPTDAKPGDAKPGDAKPADAKPADAKPGDAKPGAPKPLAAAPPKPPCLKTPIAITRGIEEDRFSLAKCDGSVAPEAVEHLSILARAGDAAKPAQPVAQLAKVPGADVAPGIRRLDPRLVERLQLVVDRFVKNPQTQKLHVISGYRPTSAGSFHATARALDFRVDGIANEELVAFCKTLGDTGCGYYPNSSFIHMDVREPGTGHVAWIDASGPGEAPRYVPTWPPPKAPDAVATVDPATDIFLSLFAKQNPGGDDETPPDPKTATNVPPPPPPPAAPLVPTWP